LLEFPLQSTDAAHKGVLIRRSISDPTEHAYYLRRFRRGTTPEELVRVAGSRWAVESGFEQAKQEAGLADYEVRNWTGWHRHVTLSLLAHAVLAVVLELTGESPPKSQQLARS
jgi:SRSO17 transposase